MWWDAGAQKFMHDRLTPQDFCLIIKNILIIKIIIFSIGIISVAHRMRSTFSASSVRDRCSHRKGHAII